MKKISLISFLVLLSIATSSAQTVNMKMGNPTMEEMTMTSYAEDPEAKAVILWESNLSYMQAVGGKLKLVMEYKRRMKILSEDALNAADVTLTIQDAVSASDTRNEIHDLKATAYNLVNGKIEKTKMTNATVSKQRINDYITQTHFVIPQVRVGSVIEYQYKMFFENYFDIPVWLAQCNYPVLRSDYKISLPDSFVFSFQQTGSHMGKHTEETENNSVLETVDEVHHFTWEKLPALPKDNEYLYCPTDFADKVSCELRSINIPGVLYKSFSYSQEDVNKQLLTNDSFGGRLKQKNPLRKEMEAAGIANIENVMERAKATVELLRQHVRWNGNYNLGGSSLSKVLKEGTGDNADLNFILISMLRDVDVKCFPIVMSRRSRGRLPVTHCTIDALNTFCVGIAENDSTIHFYDSSAEKGYFDVLPTDMNVDRAIAIFGGEAEWSEVTPQPVVNLRKVTSIVGRISEDGVLSADCASNLQNVAALRYRNSWEEKNDSVAFLNAFAADENIEITAYSTKNRDAFSPAMEERFSFTRQLEGDGKYYLNPLVFPVFQESPFKAESSSMPVEFPCLTSHVYSVNITLPEGYHVEETPKTLTVSIPEGAGNAKVMVAGNGNTITATCRMNINKVFFSAEEYPFLKEFFDMLANKCNEMIVISKE